MDDPDSESLMWTKDAMRPLCVHTLASTTVHCISASTAKTSDKRPGRSVLANSKTDKSSAQPDRASFPPLSDWKIEITC